MRQRVILTCLVAIGLALSIATPAFAAGVFGVGTEPQVKGPTTNIVLGSAGNLHLEPSSLTVPVVGSNTLCTVPNRSLHIVNRLTEPFWLTHSGARSRTFLRAPLTSTVSTAQSECTFSTLLTERQSHTRVEVAEP